VTVHKSCIKVRKLFKGGNYSSAETIRGNTVTERKTQKLFKGLVVGFGLKGMPGRMCDIVR
jgi:hypothetical protein